MVTYEGLFLLGALIVSIIALVVDIQTKKEMTAHLSKDNGHFFGLF